MLARLKQFFLWNRAQRLNDQSRMRAVMKSLWPWYVPLWILPAFFISDCFVNGMSDRRAFYWLLPFGACVGLLLIRSWKLELRRPEIVLLFHFGPMMGLLVSVILWAWIHDTYLR